MLVQRAGAVVAAVGRDRVVALIGMEGGAAALQGGGKPVSKKNLRCNET